MAAKLCGARNRFGKPCANYPLKGKVRCRFHGGASTGPRTPEGLARSAVNLRTHGFYSRLLPMQPDAELYDEASGEASLGPELKLLRAKLGKLIVEGAADRAIMDCIEGIRRLVSVEKQSGAPVAPAMAPGAFTVNFGVLGVRPEDEEIEMPELPPAEIDSAGQAGADGTPPASPLRRRWARAGMS